MVKIAYFNGTSAATPFAAGLVACWYGACLEFGIEPTIDEMRDFVLSNTVDVYDEGEDDKTGKGVVCFA